MIKGCSHGYWLGVCPHHRTVRVRVRVRVTFSVSVRVSVRV